MEQIQNSLAKLLVVVNIWTMDGGELRRDARAELLVPMRSMAATTARQAGDGFCRVGMQQHEYTAVGKVARRYGIMDQRDDGCSACVGSR
jgi:hypothetical protein